MKKKTKSYSWIWWIVGLILLFLGTPIFYFRLFVLQERSKLEKDIEEFHKQKFDEKIFKKSRGILHLAEYVEKNKSILIQEECLVLPNDTIRLNTKKTISSIVDSLKILLKEVKIENVIAYNFCKPKYSRQSKSVLSTEIDFKAERLANSSCDIKHYIYNNKIVSTTSNPENVYEYNDLEKDTFFIGTFRYSIRIRPNSF